MAERPFAKLFDVAGRQVLVTREIDPDDEKTPCVVRQVTSFAGSRVSMSACWPGSDEGEAKMQDFFDAYGQPHAEEFVAGVAKLAEDSADHPDAEI